MKGSITSANTFSISFGCFRIHICTKVSVGILVSKRHAVIFIFGISSFVINFSELLLLPYEYLSSFFWSHTHNLEGANDLEDEVRHDGTKM